MASWVSGSGSGSSSASDSGSGSGSGSGFASGSDSGSGSEVLTGSGLGGGEGEVCCGSVSSFGSRLFFLNNRCHEFKYWNSRNIKESYTWAMGSCAVYFSATVNTVNPKGKEVKK